MKGLLLKDLYTLGSYKKTFLLQVVLVVVFNIAFRGGALYMVALLSITGISAATGAFTFDESSHWDRYACSLPVRRGAVVKARYLMALVSLGIVLAASLLVSILIAVILPQPGNAAVIAATAGVILFINMLSLAIVMPFAFWLGSEKARVATTLSYLVVFGAVVGPFLLSPELRNLLFSDWLLLFWIGVGLLLFAAALFTASFFVSRRIYAKREF